MEEQWCDLETYWEDRIRRELDANKERVHIRLKRDVSDIPVPPRRRWDLRLRYWLGTKLVRAGEWLLMWWR